MRIIQLVYSLSSGGAEKFVVNLSNELVEMGHEVCICMLLSNQNNQNIFYKESLDPRIKIHFFQFSHGFTLGKVRKVCDYIGGYRPDVVHCHLNVIPYIFPLVIKKSRIRFIHTLHSVAKAASGTKLQNPINKFLYRRHWIVPVTISKECSRTFQEFYAIKTDVLIENGCPQVYPSMEYSQIKVSSSLIK